MILEGNYFPPPPPGRVLVQCGRPGMVVYKTVLDSGHRARIWLSSRSVT